MITETSEALVPPEPSAPAESTLAPRPRNLALGFGLLFAGALGTFFLMSLDRRVSHAPLWGLFGTLMSAAGVLELLGLLRATRDDAQLPRGLLSALPGEAPWLAPRMTVPIAVAMLALAAVVPGARWLLIALGLLALMASALRRPGLFVFVSASLLLLPMLGSYGLWDPWETHYGEVAREILARHDWITLWWAQDEWFRSKPILIFWIEALTWGALDVAYAPDSNPDPEWAVRLPHYVLAMGALMASYGAVARIFGRRPAVIASLVLATTPYFFFLAHQAITDMPFVATMTIALALFTIAVEEDRENHATVYRVGRFAVSAQSVVVAAVVAVALPQALYLISRNITFVVDEGLFAAHLDQFLFGSAGNPSIPGNPGHRTRTPYLAELYYQPFAQGLLWLAGLCALVWLLRKEQRTGALAMYGFYLFCSLSWMAKGIPGFALPGLIAGLYLLASGRWSLLLSGQLRIAPGILTLAVTGLPWYVAMYARLGPFFTDRLLIHDHINRLAQGVHGDTGSIQYFLWQLGYGAFPWIGLTPLGFAAWLYLFPGEGEQTARHRRTAMLLALWSCASFALFSAMITKFHHYIFPAVPPLALLVGLFIDRALGPSGSEAKQRWAVVLCLAGSLLWVLAWGGLYGDVRGVIPEDVSSAERAGWVAEHAWSVWAVIGCALLGASVLFLGTRLLNSAENGPDTVANKAPVGLGMVASAALVAFAGRDLSWSLTERPYGHERLIHLFVYNYGRPFPDYLDYRPILSGFSIAVVLLLILAAASKLRKVALISLLCTSFWFSAWALNVYMIDLSPHWGQRELIKRYYEERRGPEEPLIAWQMNWKGENLYTGNRVHVFVQLDNKAITKWLEQHKGARAYFVLEHTRLANFKRMMGTRRVEELTGMRDNNKFLLVKAEI